jgi:hypothetical protein
LRNELKLLVSESSAEELEPLEVEVKAAEAALVVALLRAWLADCEAFEVESIPLIP